MSKENCITISDLKKHLNYNQETGEFTWTAKRGRCAKGENAGCRRSEDGYIIIRVDGVIYYAHRLAWMFANNAEIPYGIEVDHIDGDKGNNSAANLRLATSQQNKYNTYKMRTNTSGVKGVTYRKNKRKWQAQIGWNDRCIYLGSFDSFEDAVHARKMAEAHYCKEFARAA